MDRRKVFVEEELSGLADLVIQFINSSVLGSRDIAAYKTSRNVLILLKHWWEVMQGKACLGSGSLPRALGAV